MIEYEHHPSALPDTEAEGMKYRQRKLNVMKDYKYIFWDLDGTIINSYNGVTRSVQYALSKFGIDEQDPDTLRRYIGPPLRDSFQKISGLTREQADQGLDYYRERYNKIGLYECDLFPQVKETLQYYQTKGKVQFLSSSKPEVMCRKILHNLKVDHCFDEIVGASLDGKIDTKQEVLHEAFRRAESYSGKKRPPFQKNDVVLIGDTKFDAAGARQCGIDCIGVEYGFGTDEELRENGVLGIADDLQDLRKMLP